MKLADVKGVGDATLKKLRSLNIETTEQLIGCLPKSYIDFSLPVLSADAEEGQFCLFKLKIIKVSGLVRMKNGLTFFNADAVDADYNPKDITNKCTVKLVWFNQPYVLKTIQQNGVYLCFGKVKKNGGRADLVNPQIEAFDNAEKLTGIMPVYRTKGILYQRTLRGLIKNALGVYSPARIITDEAVERRKLKPLSSAYYEAHFPATLDSGIDAQRRIALEDTVKEIIYYKIINRSAKNTRYYRYDEPISAVSGFVNRLPYCLTDTQKAAVQDIYDTLVSERKLNRLLIGDVGSGKTVVALIAMLYAVKCGYQAAIMAPTEILAEQHYRTACKYFQDENIEIVYLSASVKGRERKAALGKIASGEADIIIGTHSLFQSGVEFKNLAFAVIDEQHKFGVAQKFDLQQKGVSVDTLTLTATPIPRSVLMLMYDELQLSVIDKNHVTPVNTRIISDNKKSELFAYIRDEAKKGNQSFIVCPRIFDSEGVETYGALSLYKDLKEGIFEDINVAVIHGKMKAADKNKIMRNFSDGLIDVLISTTVIEVGIDIKNATSIAVLNSERFGLATLHQLRGRVGRGDKEAYCFLHTAVVDNPRLNALCAYDDGYKLAELDYTLRGGGDYLGTRQSGDTDGDKYIVPLTPSLISEAKDIVVNDLLPGGIELTAEDLEYYGEKFRDITLS